MPITATSFPEASSVTNIDVGHQSGMVAVGYNNGTAGLKIKLKNGFKDLLFTSFGAGPCWVGLDEMEGVMWAAVMNGMVYNVSLEAAGKTKTDFKCIGEHSAEILSATMNKENGYFITADSKGDIGVWNTKTHVIQPRRIITAPECEKWHLISSYGNLIVACRHNPDVHVFDLAGDSHEVRSLSTSTLNTRQIRSLSCRETFFVAGCTDGSLQRIFFASKSASNPFTSVPQDDEGRLIIHKDPVNKARYPIEAITVFPSRDDCFLTSGPLGLFITKVKVSTKKAENFTARLVSTPVGQTAATKEALIAVAGQQMIAIPWNELKK
eukprot:TRINITY_DN8617_c3_g1_i1.p1 TRINITY_DN8617_c3_g1~~TRINITY_DN8617_c3_g1_i1.p1  ORF type:complete len:331 (+),score=60.31 TRINITY_DN8617_c3_g1_i1:24-995(+)